MIDWQLGEFLTRWSVRAAVAAVLASWWWARSAGPDSNRRIQLAYRFWILGLFCYLLHVAMAFHSYHDWSHTAAFEHTSRRTNDVVGLKWGGGLYVNYVFTLVWIIDVIVGARWGANGMWRHSWYRAAIDVFFAFLIVNATVVFGPPFWRWGAGIVAGLVLLSVLGRKGFRL